MFQTEFKDLGEAASSLRKVEKEYVIVDHKLVSGEKIPKDVHQSKEWIILHKGFGKCIIEIDKCRKVFVSSPEHVIAILVPVGAEHSLEALSDISYTVLRDGFN